VRETLDAQMILTRVRCSKEGEKMQLTYNVRNVDRAIGTKLSHMIVKKIRHGGLAAGPHHRAPCAGAAANRWARSRSRACASKSGAIRTINVGKGLSGWGDRQSGPRPRPTTAGRKIPSSATPFFYGATSGKLFAAARPVSGFVCAIRAP